MHFHEIQYSTPNRQNKLRPPPERVGGALTLVPRTGPCLVVERERAAEKTG